MLVANNVMRLPIIGTICRAAGHLEVPFKDQKTSATNSMKVEVDVMEDISRHFEELAKENCIAGWFPEGRMNLGDTSKVQLFRAGGFRLPARVDCEMWCMVFIGNGACWPPRAQFGGAPASIGCKVFRLCESTHDMLHEASLLKAKDAPGEPSPRSGIEASLLKAKDAPGPNGLNLHCEEAAEGAQLREQMLYMANHTQSTVQAAVDALVSEGYDCDVPDWGRKVSSSESSAQETNLLSTRS